MIVSKLETRLGPCRSSLVIVSRAYELPVLEAEVEPWPYFKSLYHYPECGCRRMRRTREAASFGGHAVSLVFPLAKTAVPVAILELTANKQTEQRVTFSKGAV